MAEKPTYDELEQKLRQLESELAKYKEQREPEQKVLEDFRGLAERSRDAIYHYDLIARKFLFTNKIMLELYGLKKDDEIVPSKESVKLHIHPEDYENVRRVQRDSIVSGSTQGGVEYRFLHKDGTIHWMHDQWNIIRDASGKAMRIEGIVRDDTERRLSQQALKESEYKFRNLFDLNPQGVALAELQTGRLIDVNEKLCHLTGYTREELTGRTTAELGFYAIVDRSKFLDELQTHGETAELEMDIQLKDGSSITALIFSRLIEMAGEKLIISIFVDVTEKKQLEEHLRQSQKMEAVGTMAGGIAHEFNNILGIIIGNAELAADDIPEWNPASHCLEEIRTASFRAKNVVRGILSFARKSPAARKSIQIGTIIKDSLKLLRATIPTTVDIIQNIHCDSETILADPTEINQVLMNLCTNAADAMREAPGVLEVGLKSVYLDRRTATDYEGLEPGGYVQLTVRDSGTGIEPEILGRVFDPYFTTKEIDKGIGMGLAIVYGILKKNNGAIKIVSKVGQGTTVKVLFPLVRVKAESEGQEPDKSLPKGTERILLVDDEAVLVKTAKEMLERLGYQVADKTGSFDALALFEAEPEQFDLIITDMAMPMMSGEQLAQELTRIRSDVPIILCTGYSDRIDQEKADELGITAFYMKPFDKRKLADTVRSVLDEAKGSM